jgi:hypothetical protein
MQWRSYLNVLGIVAIVMSVSAAQAANLNINDAVEGQITLGHDPNWEFGVTSNGFPFGPFVPGSFCVDVRTERARISPTREDT